LDSIGGTLKDLSSVGNRIQVFPFGRELGLESGRVPGFALSPTEGLGQLSQGSAAFGALVCEEF